MRSRGESATTVITAESMADRFGVTKGTYEPVPLPRMNSHVVRAAAVLCRFVLWQRLSLKTVLWLYTACDGHGRKLLPVNRITC